MTLENDPEYQKLGIESRWPINGIEDSTFQEIILKS